MDFTQVQFQLKDLPPTYLRQGTPFTQWMDALTAGMILGTETIDQTISASSSANNARYGWLDIWGLLFDVPRLSNEPDISYLTRMKYELIAAGGPPVGMAFWIQKVWKVAATIQENLSTVGYNISLPNTLTTAQISAILSSLVAIRPAGVPFTTNLSADGLFITTVNYVDTELITGSYLTTSVGNTTVTLSAATNNTPPALPTLFLTDPTLNPSLA